MATDQSPIDSLDDGTKHEQAERLADAMLTRRRLLETTAAGGIAVGSAGFLGSAARAAEFALAATPKRGGRLRIGMVGGGSSQALDPKLAGSTSCTCRIRAVVAPLLKGKADL